MLLTELAGLATDEKNAEIRSMVKRSKGAPNGQVQDLREAVIALEQKHGMNTAEMRRRFKAGDVPDNAEFVEWLMLARLVRA